MTKEYQLDINLKEVQWNDVFKESYKIVLWNEFVNNTNPKEHWFKNHVHGFLNQLKQNCKAVSKQEFNKWDVFVVSYGMNTGSEINGNRPSIVYKASHSTKWDDLIAIPLTSALQEKQSDAYDIFVQKDATNNLFQNSFARLRQMRAVSVKRVGKAIGKITDEKLIHAINTRIQKMLWTDVQENPS